MSVLTKVFVVLHVILSIVVTTGLVVFVNRTEEFRKLNTQLTADVARAKNDSALAASETSSVRADLLAKLNVKDTELATQRQALETAQNQLGDLNTKIAELTSNSAQQASALSSTAEALKVAQQQNTAVETNFAQLRQSQDALQKQFTESNLHITDLQNKLDVTERQRRYLAEQVTQLTSENASQADLIHKNLPAIENRQGQIINPTPTIALNGVVRDKAVIAGVPYATISIGSADAVKKNMQFKVIDQSKNEFLGYLTVDTVEPHEATGRLEGPHVEQVHSGVEVRTQL